MNSVKHSHSRGKSFPSILMIVGSLVLAGAFFWLSQSPKSVIANTPDRDRLLAAYPILGSRIAPTAGTACAVCHTSSIPNLNSYGSDYLSGGQNASALTAIENTDSDGDGFTNIQELRAFTYPGNASDFPVAATATNTATQPPTATRTNTTVPSATRTNTTAPSATTGPSATTAPSSTTAPSATRTSTQAPSATGVASATSVPSATRVASATKAPTRVGTKATARPTQRVSPTPRCYRDKDDDDSRSSKEKDDGRRGRNRCPRGYHEDDRDREKEDMVSRLQAIYARSQPTNNH